MTTQKLAVISLGGHAIQDDQADQSYEREVEQIRKACMQISILIERGWQICIVHGNGPQIGELLLQQIRSEEKSAAPLFIQGAQTQGSLGFMIQNQLYSILHNKQMLPKVVTILTQVEVDQHDDAFQNPDKPIGPYLQDHELTIIQQWDKQLFAGKGWRIVVPSPKPLRILGAETICLLVREGNQIVAGGGGGVPVIRKADGYIPVEAVIDKDRTSAWLATYLQADMFIILTGVEKVSLHYNTPNQQELDQLLTAEAYQYLQHGEFAKGSMGPKIEAAIQYVEETNGLAVITDIDHMIEAANERAGTIIRKEEIKCRT